MLMYQTQNTGKKKEGFVYLDLNISVEIFLILLVFCICHLSSECDCQSCCRQTAWQRNRTSQHVENPFLNVQLVLVFLFISRYGVVGSGGSHTSGGSEV